MPPRLDDLPELEVQRLDRVLSQNWNETKVSDAGDLRDGEGGLYRWDLDA
jgi:hypothetical protein